METIGSLGVSRLPARIPKMPQAEFLNPMPYAAETKPCARTTNPILKP